MNLENRIEVGSVSEFLDAVKQIYCDQDHQLFYRGVSKIQYAAPQHDHPGIYRNKNWIDNEDKMFYELTAKCPEYFKDCKTTFEHLVMMQHYGYPTRLLDITSNPLVALYFACGGLNGSNAEDGQLISYQIIKKYIRNDDNLVISLSANLSKVEYRISYQIFFLNFLEKLISIDFNPHLSYLKGQSRSEEWNINMSRLILEIFTHNVNLNLDIEDTVEIDYKHDLLIMNIIQIIKDIKENYNDFYHSYNRNDSIALRQCTKLVMDKLQRLEIYIRGAKIQIKGLSYQAFINMVRNERYIDHSLMFSSIDLRVIQCVLPKQNNPRLIAQQGAFLLFGFKDAASDKTATPIVPNEMYGKFQIITQYENGQIVEKQQSSHKAEIIIKGSEKQKILDELKILGISNSTMFPEIDNIANELKSQYAKPL